jgi:hypothetical protein
MRPRIDGMSMLNKEREHMGLKDRAVVFTVLGGTTYSRKNRPVFWQHERPLFTETSTPPAMARLPLHSFPLIADFEVRLEQMEVLPEDEHGKSYCPFGYHIYFFSPSHGFLAGFHW